MPVLDGVTEDKVSPSMPNQTPKEYPQGFQGGGVWVIPVILQNMKLVVSIPEVNFPIKWQKREFLKSNRTALDARNETSKIISHQT